MSDGGGVYPVRSEERFCPSAHGDPRSPHTMVVSPFRHSQCSPERAGVAWFYLHSHYFFEYEKHNCFWSYDFWKNEPFTRLFTNLPVTVLAKACSISLSERHPFWQSCRNGDRDCGEVIGQVQDIGRDAFTGLATCPILAFFPVENLLWFIAFSERLGCNTEVSNGPDRHVHIGKCTSTPQFTYGKL
mgnify:CR=1 FL=1